MVVTKKYKSGMVTKKCNFMMMTKKYMLMILTNKYVSYGYIEIHVTDNDNNNSNGDNRLDNKIDNDSYKFSEKIMITEKSIYIILAYYNELFDVSDICVRSVQMDDLMAA